MTRADSFFGLRNFRRCHPVTRILLNGSDDLHGQESGARKLGDRTQRGQGNRPSNRPGELSHNLMFQCSRVKYHFCIISKCLERPSARAKQSWLPCRAWDAQHVAALLSAFMRHRCHQIQGETRGAKVRSGAVHVAALCGCEHSGFSESAGKPLSNAGALAKLNMFEHV